MPHIQAPLKRLLFTLVLATLTGAPALVNSQSSESKLPTSEFPQSVGELHMSGSHEYGDPALGYVVRFESKDASEILDVFIFPVADEFVTFEHEQIVTIYLQAAQRDINTAVDAGYYYNNTELGVVAYAVGATNILKSKHAIESEVGEVYSTIYLTEHNGTVEKIRLSVPSTAATMVLEEFETDVFDLVEIALYSLRAR